MVLVAVAALTGGSARQMEIHPAASGLIAELFLHLVLTLFMVLKRVRSAYKLLSL